MANRAANRKKRRNSGDQWMGKLVKLTVLLVAMIIGAFMYLPKLMNNISHSETSYSNSSTNVDSSFGVDPSYFPIGDKGQTVKHKYYALSYNEDTEQANWVLYRLTKKSLDMKNVPRAKRFNSDPAVKTQSAVHSDYSHSGYTRGHMAPAGDMAFSSDAMQECFYMSNMSPQLRTCNNGIWKELEETTREWALKKRELLILTGPLFLEGTNKKIGKNKVAVPSHFYKIIIDEDTKDDVAFIIPNDVSYKHLDKYIVSIDDIEEKLNMDVFDNFMADSDERSTTGNWSFNESKYQQRVNHWNKEE